VLGRALRLIVAKRTTDTAARFVRANGAILAFVRRANLVTFFPDFGIAAADSQR
jgi:hypothetical protein